MPGTWSILANKALAKIIEYQRTSGILNSKKFFLPSCA